MPRRWVPIGVLAFAAVLLIAAAVLFRSSPSAQAARSRDERLAAVATSAGTGEFATTGGLVVDAARIETSDPRVIVDLTVTLEAVRRVVIGAEVAGRVVELGVEENRSVEAGDLLVRLDSALADAAVERARAGVLRTRSAASLASQQSGRPRSLSGQGVASKAEYDRTESEANSSDAQVAEARAALAEAETRLEKTRITAPFAGVVSELELEPGAYLRVGDPVVTLSDLSQIEINVGVDDRQILALRSGAPVRVSVDAYPGEWFDGVIYSLGRTPHPVTHKYRVPVRIPNADGRLLPGMLGRARFILGEAGPTLRIPRRAVSSEFEIDYLYVLQAEGGDSAARVERRRVAVRPVPFHPELLDVMSGLVSGERIALSGVRDLRDGGRVRVRERPAHWGGP